MSFETFAAGESEPLLVMAIGLTRNLDDALDLRQDTLLSALEHWSELRSHPRPAAWVRTVLFNKFADRHRRSGRLRASLARMSRSRPGPEDPASLSVDTLGFWEAAAELPRRQLEVLLLRVVDDATTREIAETLGIAEGTVRVHVRAARSHLSTALGVPVASGTGSTSTRDEGDDVQP